MNFAAKRVLNINYFKIDQSCSIIKKYFFDRVSNKRARKYMEKASKTLSGESSKYLGYILHNVG